MNVGNLERTTQQDLMVSLYNFELITYRDKKVTAVQSSITVQTDVM